MRKSILLIDDNAIQLRALKGVLADDYDVQMATSGLKAVELIRKKSPDAIFLDYDMPECDGRKTLQIIRGIEGAEEIPVVFLTGVSSVEHIKAVLKLNPAAYLLKPASADVIFETLDTIWAKEQSE